MFKLALLIAILVIVIPWIVMLALGVLGTVIAAIVEGIKRLFGKEEEEE